MSIAHVVRVCSSVRPGADLLASLRRLDGGRRAPHAAVRRHLHVSGRPEGERAG